MNIIIAIILFIPILLYIFYNIFILKDKNYLKYTFIGIFTIYIFGLLKYAIFPIYINSMIALEIHKTQSAVDNIMSNTNLIPFFNSFDLKDFFLNIIMTFPVGFLVPCINKKNTSQMIIWGLIIGVGIETIQLLLGFIQGFTFRNININDSIANLLGVLFGYVVLKIFIKIYIQVFENAKNRVLVYLMNYFKYNGSVFK